MAAAPGKRKRKDPSAKDASAEAISGIARAVSHPLRVRILESLAVESGSAKSLSQRLEVPLGNVAYHVRVLHQRCKVLELVGSRRVRGAHERFFRLKPDARLDREAWPTVPQSLLNGLRGSLLRSFVNASVAALGSGSMDTGEETTFTCLTVAVDRTGWIEVNEAMREAIEKVERAEVRSASRASKGSQAPVISGVVGAAAFQAAKPAAGEQTARTI